MTAPFSALSNAATVEYIHAALAGFVTAKATAHGEEVGIQTAFLLMALLNMFIVSHSLSTWWSIHFHP